MSSPGVTCFCENGHIAQEVLAGYEAAKPTECPVCQSTALAFELNWGYSDYGPFLVPTEPLRIEEKTIVVHLRIYDVSRLFEHKYRSRDEEIL